MKQLTVQKFKELVSDLPSWDEDVYAIILPYLKDVEEELKICTGCGHKSTEPIKPNFRACCPDSNYIPLDEYLCFSVYKPSLTQYIKGEPQVKLDLGSTTLNVPTGDTPFLHQHDPSRLQIAKDMMRTLLTIPGSAGYEWAAHEALRYADELIKQSKQQP